MSNEVWLPDHSAANSFKRFNFRRNDPTIRKECRSRFRTSWRRFAYILMKVSCVTRPTSCRYQKPSRHRICAEEFADSVLGVRFWCLEEKS